MKKNKKLQIILPLLGAVVISALVSGATVKAENGLTVLDKLIQLLQLAKEADTLPAGEANLGAQAAVSDDITIGKFNALALVTDPTTSANANFQNFTLDYVGLVGQVGSATNTPLSVRNTWAQTVYAEDAFIQCVGTPSSTLYAFAGTSTVPSSPDILTTATTTLANQFGALLGGVVLDTNISGHIITSSATSTVAADGGRGSAHRSSIPVLPNEYLNIAVRSDGARNSATSTIWRGCTDVMVGVTIKGHSTSTVNY